MRRIFVLTVAALLSATVYAGPVSKEMALQIASKVFAAEPATKGTASTGLKVLWDGEFEATKGSLDPAFFVVGREGGGFVIVAGNDNITPVLGFSYDNPFAVEGMPGNVRSFMEEIKVYCRSGKSATPQVRKAWEQFFNTKATASPLSGLFTNEYLGSRTNLWNQTNPANFYCPNVEGQDLTSLCGCVALSTALIFAWFGSGNQVTSPTGIVPAYTYTSENGISVSIPEHNLSTTYDWAGMHTLASEDARDFYNQVLSYNTSFPISRYYYGYGRGTTLTELGDNVAHLLYDIATLLQAGFNDPDFYGTYAFFNKIPYNVAPVFGYNNGAHFVSPGAFTSGQWLQALRTEIDKHPVIYTGQSSSSGGGHAYVVDGYALYDSSTLVFHYNMGWGGLCNGYYHSDIQDEYDYSHTALFDFYPNLASSAAKPVLGFCPYEDNGLGGIVVNEGYNTGWLYLTLSKFFNYGAGYFTGNIAAGITDYNGTVKEYSSLSNVSDLMPNSGWNAMYRIVEPADTPVFGDYVSMYYKESTEEVYLPFRANAHGPYPSSVPFYPAAFIKTASSYHAGDYLVLELCNCSYPYDDATWYVTTPDGTRTAYTLDDYSVLLQATGEYKIEVNVPNKEKVVAFIVVN